MNDIDLSGVTWSAKTFMGEFNGNGYAISNLTGTAGLFGGNQGTIKNLSLLNIDIAGTHYAGGFATYNGGTIENCTVSGKLSTTGFDSGAIAGHNSAASVIKNCVSYVNLTKISGSGGVGGIAGQTSGRIENCVSYGSVDGGAGLVYNLGTDGLVSNCRSESDVKNGDGFVGTNSGTIKNSSASGTVTNGSGFVGTNRGTICNATASGNTTTGSGFAGSNSGTIENASASGNVTANGSGFVGTNSGTICNATASGNVTGTGTNGGFVGNNSGANALIENCSASGNVTSTGSSVGGFAGNNGGIITKAYSTGNVDVEGRRVGGFVGNNSGEITNAYTKGSVSVNGEYVGGFVGANASSIQRCYSLGAVSGGAYVGGFAGGQSGNIRDSYSLSVVEATSGPGCFASVGDNRGTSENCYANSEQSVDVNINQKGVTAMPASWFEDGSNLMFLGDAYDYYYNPPELWGNGEAHPEEFTQFQVGANSGEKNTLNMNMTFRMYDFYGDVTSRESSEATLERVDAFKERLSEHRSMIGSVRNRLDSVLESQSIRLENLNSSHSTIVDTDFAAETAKLTRNQILQQATTSLLAQANMIPNIALSLLQ